ncbi:FecR family protein [Tenacibaculum adriaticum]|uniref:FecR family protein n=1 Tax=Tenacibaculum adriaticum TaxID=413713 RepID=A0A5S5DV39_9FLAO|nr:FecR domain-containing protein [Tenacibaculum adriaticum]TYP98916.1 FecR family protein [Tenacibaculum adriaticum]
MKKNTYNSIHDFLNDTSFSNWALNKQLSDVTFWNYWLENNPDKKQIANEAKDILLGIKFKPTPVSEDKINFEWNKLEAKIKASKNQQIDNKKNNYKTWIGLAASILLLLSISIYFFTKPNMITYKTAYGEVLDLKLKDGSLVTLNSNSSISYNEKETRKVWLKGEAFFTVDKKEVSNAKFWVITNDLEVEVYGTLFNVNAKKQKTQVYLEEGNIWLSLKNGTSKKMKPGNFIVYSAEQDKILEEKKSILGTEQTSWKDGKLIFNNYSLDKALSKVTETYGCEVVYENSESKNILITGAVPTTNIDICLKAIEKSTNVRIIKENTKLVVYNK